MRFLSPDGVDLGAPDSAPQFPPVGATTYHGECEGIIGLPLGLFGSIMSMEGTPDGTLGNIFVYNADFTTSVVGPTGAGDPDGIGFTDVACFSLGRDGSGRFYGLSTNHPRLFRYDANGAQSGTWLLSGVVRQVVAVNQAGTIAYVNTSPGSSVIESWDLVHNVSLGTFATAASGYAISEFNGIWVLAGGDVLVNWWNASAGNAYIKRYTPAGAEVQTYTLPNMGPGIITPGLTDYSFWFNYYGQDITTPIGCEIVELRVSDGAVLHSFVPNGPFRFDGAFCVMSQDIGVPVTGPPPDPKPAIPTVTCIPSTSVLSSPSAAAGCNQGGTGFIATYTGASGTVPVAADPDDGETLTGKRTVHLWVEVTHTHYPSGDQETLRYAMTDLDDTLRKEGRLLSIGDTEHGFSDAQGNLVAATIEFTLSDVAGRPIGTRLADPTLKYFQRDEIAVFALSEHGRRTGAVPRRLGRVLAQDIQYGTPVTVKASGTDHFFIDGGAFGPDRQMPGWLIPPYYVNAPPDVYSKALPIILGEVGDEGAIDPVTNLPRSRGLCPWTFVGYDGLATGPGGTVEIWGRGNICAFASYKAVGMYGSNLGGGLYGRANATSDGASNSVITLGGSPDLSTVPTDASITITLYTLKGRQASLITAVSGSTVTIQNQIAMADATGVDWIIDEAQPDRTRIDIAARNGKDVMVFGYPNYVRTTPYEDIMGSDGIVYRNTDAWVRGPLLDDHLAGIVTIAFNMIGVEDRGDGTGLPITDYFTAYNWFVENIVIRNSHIPTGPGQLWPQHDGDLTTYADGTYMVRGSSFVAAQARTVTAFGGRGLQVSAYFGTQSAMQSGIQLWNDNGWCRTGENQHGQICVLKLNLYDDPSTWPRIEHVSRIFGPVTITNPQTEIENVVQGQCDWDPDFGRYRNALVQRPSADGILHNKGVRKLSPVIDGRLTHDPLQFQFILDERKDYAKDGPTYAAIQGDIGLVDYPIGTGILLTTIMGPGAAGYVDQPMIILTHHIALDSRLVTTTCLVPTFLTPPDFDYRTTTTMATGLTLLQQGCFGLNQYGGGDENEGIKFSGVWDAMNQPNGFRINNTGNQLTSIPGIVIQVRIRLRVDDASITVTPRLYNITDSAVATTSGAAACAGIADDFSGTNQEQTLTITPVSGDKYYKVQGTQSGASFQGFISGIAYDIYVP